MFIKLIKYVIMYIIWCIECWGGRSVIRCEQSYRIFGAIMRISFLSPSPNSYYNFNNNYISSFCWWAPLSAHPLPQPTNKPVPFIFYFLFLFLWFSNFPFPDTAPAPAPAPFMYSIPLHVWKVYFKFVTGLGFFSLLKLGPPLAFWARPFYFSPSKHPTKKKKSPSIHAWCNKYNYIYIEKNENLRSYFLKYEVCLDPLRYDDVIISFKYLNAIFSKL